MHSVCLYSVRDFDLMVFEDYQVVVTETEQDVFEKWKLFLRHERRFPTTMEEEMRKRAHLDKSPSASKCTKPS